VQLTKPVVVLVPASIYCLHVFACFTHLVYYFKTAEFKHQLLSWLALLEEEIRLDRLQYSLFELRMLLRGLLELMDNFKDRALAAVLDIGFVLLSQSVARNRFNFFNPVMLNQFKKGVAPQCNLNFVWPQVG